MCQRGSCRNVLGDRSTAGFTACRATEDSNEGDSWGGRQNEP